MTEVPCCRIPRWVLYCRWRHREPLSAKGSLGFYPAHLLLAWCRHPSSSKPLLVDRNPLVSVSLEELFRTFPRRGLWRTLGSLFLMPRGQPGAACLSQTSSCSCCSLPSLHISAWLSRMLAVATPALKRTESSAWLQNRMVN